MSSIGIAVGLGQMMGFILIPVVVVGAGVFIQNRINKGKDYETSVSWPRNVSIGVAILVLLGQCSSPSRNAGKVGKGAKPAIVETVNNGPAQPVPEIVPDEHLRSFENEFQTLVIESTNSEMDIKIDPNVVSTRTEIVKINELNVYKTKMIIPDLLYMLHFVGTVDYEEKIVVCRTGFGSSFVYIGSKCEEQVLGVFGGGAS